MEGENSIIIDRDKKIINLLVHYFVKWYKILAALSQCGKNKLHPLLLNVHFQDLQGHGQTGQHLSWHVYYIYVKKIERYLARKIHNYDESHGNK